MRVSRVTLPRRLSLSGLWIAAIGFFVTRFTVTLAAYDQPIQFYLAGILPLILGLLLAAFGVALVVGAFDLGYIRTVAAWCTIGTLAMLILVMLTLVGANPDGLGSISSVRSKVYLSNFLIGGSILGTLIGLYAAQNTRQRLQLSHQANRLVTLNRILRHEVLNAITVIRGSTEAIESAGRTQEPVDQIQEKSERVVDTIEDVKYLTQTAQSEPGSLYPTDLGSTIEETLESIAEAYPEADVDCSVAGPDDVAVWADPRLSHALYHLVENGIVHNDNPHPTVDVEVDVGRDVACVVISDNGPGLPDDQRAILETGAIPSRDDPRSGFGTNLARMFVERYGGDITVDRVDGRTVIEVELRRAIESAPPENTATDVRSYGIEPSQLVTAVGASLLAGAVMGGVIQTLAGVVPVIGALYGVPNPIVGWITHEFHSVVFGLVYAGLALAVPRRYTRGVVGCVAIGLVWSLVLWFVAAGFVMPLWLRLLALAAPIPSLNLASLIGHVVWGLTLGALYHFGTTLSFDTGRWTATAP